jgi:type I restriction enzyme S subunit
MQDRIAEIAGRYDDLIENYNKQISLLEATAQNIYREWFVRGRCPDAAFEKESRLPVGWYFGTIGDCIRSNRDTLLKVLCLETLVFP